MQIDSASKDLSLKQMNFKISEMNKLIKKHGFKVARILTREEARDRGCVNDDKLAAIVERKYTTKELISEVLKVKVTGINWSSSDTIDIEYLEK